MHYSADLESKLPSINASLPFEIKTTNLSLYNFRGQNNRAAHVCFVLVFSRAKRKQCERADEKHVQLQILSVCSFSISTQKYHIIAHIFFKLHFISHNQIFLVLFTSLNAYLFLRT